MDVAKSELELFKSQHETALNQLRDAKDNLDKARETRTHRKRYQLPELNVENFACRLSWHLTNLPSLNI